MDLYLFLFMSSSRNLNLLNVPIYIFMLIMNAFVLNLDNAQQFSLHDNLANMSIYMNF